MYRCIYIYIYIYMYIYQLSHQAKANKRQCMFVGTSHLHIGFRMLPHSLGCLHLNYSTGKSMEIMFRRKVPAASSSHLGHG